MRISYGTTINTRERIIEYIKDEKILNPEFKVLNIGGSYDNWAAEVSDINIDMLPNCDYQMDICSEIDWEHFWRTKCQGHFDYVICTHVLEDLYNPYITIDWMERVGRAGIITMPSKFTECTHIENENWLGYFHHRWIFLEDEDGLVIVPKLPMLQHFFYYPFMLESEDIVIEWNNTIPYKVFMNNYLGPGWGIVVENLRKIL